MKKKHETIVSKVISISGGRSSAMLLKIMQDNGMIDDKTQVCFANTGKESPETLDFVHECSIRWGIPVVWLEFTDAFERRLNKAGEIEEYRPLFKIVDYASAARKGEPFAAKIRYSRMLPNPTQRICTAELKIKTIRRYIRSLGQRGVFNAFLGLRYDEPTRVARKKAQNVTGKEAEYCYMPLHDMRITIKERDAFWAAQDFNLEISSVSDNCDLCFLKAKYQLIWRLRQNPELADWWIEQEEYVSNLIRERDLANGKKTRRRNTQFRKEYSYRDLLYIAQSQLYLDLPTPRRRCSQSVAAAPIKNLLKTNNAPAF